MDKRDDYQSKRVIASATVVMLTGIFKREPMRFCSLLDTPREAGAVQSRDMATGSREVKAGLEASNFAQNDPEKIKNLRRVSFEPIGDCPDSSRVAFSKS